MDKELEKDLLAYCDELKGNGPVINYSHGTLARLWEKWGRETVERAIVELPAFQELRRRPYSIQ